MGVGLRPSGSSCVLQARLWAAACERWKEEVSSDIEETPGQHQVDEIWQWDELALLSHAQLSWLLNLWKFKWGSLLQSVQTWVCSKFLVLQAPEKGQTNNQTELGYVWHIECIFCFLKLYQAALNPLQCKQRQD